MDVVVFFLQRIVYRVSVHGGELCAYDSLCSFDDPLKGLLLLYCCVTIPHSNAPFEDALHQTSVDLGELLTAEAGFFQGP